MNLYNFLGVKKDATSTEIKAAHRERVKKVHPDITGEREEFEKVQHAYAVLINPDKRSYYDTHGEEKAEFEDVAMAIIAEMFNSMLMQDLPPDFDYIAGIKAALNNTIAESIGRKVMAERDIRKFVRLKKKFRRKKGRKEGTNFFINALKIKIRDHTVRIGRADEVITNFKRALVLLDDYEFRQGDDYEAQSL